MRTIFFSKPRAGLIGVAIIVVILQGSFGASAVPSYENSIQRGSILPCGQTAGCPTGLASYGYDNATGTYFSVESNESIGEITSYALQANNSLAPGIWANNDPVLSNSSTLQLNNVLVVNNSGGSQDVYWPQNVLCGSVN